MVEDNLSLLRAVSVALASRARKVHACASVGEAREAIARVDGSVLLVLDVSLPDGTARDVFDVARDLPRMPAVVVMSGAASAEDAFGLAKLGAAAFVPKPLDLATLERAIDEAAARAPSIVATARDLVGQLPIHDAERAVRRTMVEEALARSGGKRTGAARLLGISRQLLQHMIRA